jgi:hypothetical protein
MGRSGFKARRETQASGRTRFIVVVMGLLLIFGSEDAGEEALGKRDPGSEAHIVQDLIVTETCGAEDLLRKTSERVSQ